MKKETRERIEALERRVAQLEAALRQPAPPVYTGPQFGPLYPIPGQIPTAPGVAPWPPYTITCTGGEPATYAPSWN